LEIFKNFYIFLKFTALQKGGLCNFAGMPLELFKLIKIGPWPEEEGNQREVNRVPVERATGGED
jgi:hypothetical protein